VGEKNNPWRKEGNSTGAPEGMGGWGARRKEKKVWRKDREFLAVISGGLEAWYLTSSWKSGRMFEMECKWKWN
jgi:hypothetical protein